VPGLDRAAIILYKNYPVYKNLLSTMKIKTIAYSLIAAAFIVLLAKDSLFAQAKYDVKGTVKGITSGTVKLATYNEENRTQTVVDSAAINNGIFELKGSLNSPQMVTISLEPGNWCFGVFVENGPVNVTADTAGAEHFDYAAYGMGKGANIVKFTETGSKNYDDWMAYEHDPGQKQYEPVFAELDKKFKAAGKDIDAQYRVRDEMDSVQRLLYVWQKQKIDAYVAKDPSAVAGIYMFNDLYRFVIGTMPYAELDAMLNKYTGFAKESPYYKTLSRYRTLLKAVQPGSIAPDFTLLKRDSSKFTLSENRGKYLMIDLWASWCHPCRQAIPHWKSVYQKYHDRGFDIVSMSLDSRMKDWTKAMDEEKMPWTQIKDEFPKRMPGKVASLYMTSFIPFYVLLDKEGKILVYSGDEGKIDTKLKEIYGN
jgi:thiol-disulfide isomerase/thioredoxin